MISKMTVTEERISELGTAIGGEIPVRVKKPSLGQTQLSIKGASREDAALVKKWVTAISGDAEFVGARTSPVKSSEVADWINNSVGAYLLYDESKKPVAFVNIVSREGSEVEVGRLVVDPTKRRRGFGSTLVRNVCLALSSAYKKVITVADPITLARVVTRNTVGLAFIETLPFVRVKEEKETWYQYYLDGRNRRMLGELMESLRKEVGMSQATLAFKCGVQRAAINMVESGLRIPSLELLRSICRVLAPRPEDQVTRVGLLLASLGEYAEETPGSYQTITSAIADMEHNVWVATDTMAEMMDEKFFDYTKEALSKGFNRWFFMPRQKWEIQGEPIKRRLENELAVHGRKTVEEHFKFYEAPEWICYCRLVIRNPESLDQTRVSVGGENFGRMLLTETQALALHSMLRSGIMSADALAEKGSENAADGFRRRFPPPKGR
jgi:DNA-binding XRE family transcriptional regulator/GNAT superfamily N-acetyltransferase